MECFNHGIGATFLVHRELVNAREVMMEGPANHSVLTNCQKRYKMSRTCFERYERKGVYTKNEVEYLMLHATTAFFIQLTEVRQAIHLRLPAISNSTQNILKS